MSPLEFLDAATSERIAKTLAWFVAEGTAIALSASLAARLFARSSCRARYAIHIAALLSMALAAIITFAAAGSRAARNPALDALPAESAPPIATRILTPPGDAPAPAGENAAGEGSAAGARALPAAIALAYLAGVAAMLVRLGLAVQGGRRLRRRAAPVDDPVILACLARQARALAIRARPALAFCERVVVPTVVGVIRPVILLPFSLASGLAAEHVEMLLAHELAHIRRLDPLVQIIQRLIEAALFFHPAVWWISRRASIEREHSCDDLVVAAGAGSEPYAAALVEAAARAKTEMRGLRRMRAASLAAAGPSSLRIRVLRLLEPRGHERLRLPSGLTVLLAAAALVAAIGIWGGRGEAKPAGMEAPAERLSPQVEKLRALHDRLDRGLAGGRGEELAKLGEVADELIAAAEQVRKAPADPQEKRWAAYFLAYGLNINRARASSRIADVKGPEERAAWSREYGDRILGLCREILEDKGVEGDLRMRTLSVTGQAHTFTGELAKAIEAYETFQREFPDSPYLERVWTALVRCQLDAEEFPKAEESARIFLSRWPESSFAPHIGDFLFKSLTGQGKIEEAIERTKGPVSGEYANRQGFNRAWCHFALGEFETARTILSAERNRMTPMKDRGELDNASLVYLGRIETIETVLDTLIGRLASPWPVDWVSDETPSLKECKGRPTAILFRSYDYERAHAVLRFLNDLRQADAARILPQILTIAYYKEDGRGAWERQRVRAEAQKLGLRFGVGIDLSSDRSVFAAYQAAVGSHTLVILDREGRVVWYDQDPRPPVFGTIRRIIERLGGS